MGDYDAMEELWEAIYSGEEMPDVLRAHATALELEGSPGPMLEGDGEPHVLIVVCIDAAAITSLELVPVRLLDDRLTAALATINGRTFAGGADLGTAQWDAAILVMSALALEMRDAAELARWAHDDGSQLPAEDIAHYWNRWSGCDVRAWSDLARPTTSVYRLRRSM